MELDGNGINHVSSLSRIDVFLSAGSAVKERNRLISRRLLGIVQGITPEQDIDALLKKGLKNLDYDALKEDRERLIGVITRFFRNPEVEIIGISPYFDRTSQAPKTNVLLIDITLARERRLVVLKHMDEGPRRESLALRINNLLTDSPIPFMTSGYTSLQMGIRGIGLDEYPDLETEESKREFNFNLGKIDEFGRLIALGDRKAEDLLQLGTRVSHVDFGAAFSEHESIERFAYPNLMDSFRKGQERGKITIKNQYEARRTVVDTLLARADEGFIEMINAEDKIKLFPVSNNPTTIIYSYLESIRAS